MVVDVSEGPPPCSEVLIRFELFAIAAAGKIVLPDTVFSMLAMVSVLLMLSPFEGRMVSNVMVDMLLEATVAAFAVDTPADVVVRTDGATDSTTLGVPALLTVTFAAFDTLIEDMIERTCCDTFMALSVSSLGCDSGDSCGIVETIRCPAAPVKIGLREFSRDRAITCTGMMLCLPLTLPESDA